MGISEQISIHSLNKKVGILFKQDLTINIDNHFLPLEFEF